MCIKKLSNSVHHNHAKGYTRQPTMLPITKATSQLAGWDDNAPFPPVPEAEGAGEDAELAARVAVFTGGMVEVLASGVVDVEVTMGARDAVEVVEVVGGGSTKEVLEVVAAIVVLSSSSSSAVEVGVETGEEVVAAGPVSLEPPSTSPWGQVDEPLEKVPPVVK